MLFNLIFAQNAILSSFVLFFLIIDLYFLIPAVIAETSNPTAEIWISTRIPSKEAFWYFLLNKSLWFISSIE